MKASEAVYAEDEQGNILSRCGWCRAWCRLALQADIVVGFWGKRTVVVEGEEVEKWVPFTRHTNGCTECQELYWWEVAHAGGRPGLTPFLSAETRRRMATRAHRERLERQVAELTKQLGAAGGV